jgi:hypothetical protein
MRNTDSARPRVYVCGLHSLGPPREAAVERCNHHDAADTSYGRDCFGAGRALGLKILRSTASAIAL